jgi:poly-gamma-glutamate synthesis protein (capsule biosynthesis protein)
MPIEGLAPLADAPAPARLDEERFRGEVAAARRQADAVIVTVHWGAEYRTVPTPTQERLGRALVDAGASLVLGHHPHVLQPLERYRDGVIAYSLGNLVFDQHQPERRLSAILRCELGRGAPACTAIPLVIDGCAPRPADPATGRRIEQLLASGR